MAQIGIRKFDDLIGRSDLLDMRHGIEHWKAKGLDFSKVFYQPEVPGSVARASCRRAGSRPGQGARQQADPEAAAGAGKQVAG